MNRIACCVGLIVACSLAGCPEIFQAPPAATQQDGAAGGSPQESPEYEQVKAEAGVGKAGQSLRGETGVAGVIVEPAKKLLSFKQEAVFNIQIPQAMQLYKATEGHFPESHDEFMTKIVRANNLRLPELPQGQEYIYDPQQGELMVKRPAKR